MIRYSVHYNLPVDFAVELAHWEHPDYPSGFDGLRVDDGRVTFLVRRNTGRVAHTLLAFLLSVGLSAALFVLAWWLFHVVVFVFMFAPLVLAPLLRKLLGPGAVETVEIAAQRSHIRNVGGGGRYVAFGLLLPPDGREIAVTVRLPDEPKAQRLRLALQADSYSPPAEADNP